MNGDLTHLTVEAEGLAARFVAGTLPTGDRERFDAHFLECEACQREVELAMTLRAAGPVARGPRVGWRWAAVGLTAAAALAVLLLRPADVNPQLVALGGLDRAPIYLGIAVRREDADARFNAAMESYQRGDYIAAASALSAVQGVADAPPVRFFIGASALMIGEDSLALSAYDALLAFPDSPYHDEARYYRAKTQLRFGREAQALDDLRAIRDPALRAQADALADSIGAIPPR